MRKRKANKYLLTQQRWRTVVDCWKQKAEDEERRARKPADCRFFAPLVPMENKRKTEIEDRTKREREGRMDRRRKESTDRWSCQ